MKKVTVILFLFLFLLAQSGIAITVHWCGGKISSVGFFSLFKPGCKCGKKAMKPGCCKNKTTIFKAKNDLAQINKLTFKQAVPENKIITGKLIAVMPYLNFNSFSSPFYYPPPNNGSLPLYLLEGVFLL